MGSVGSNYVSTRLNNVNELSNNITDTQLNTSPNNILFDISSILQNIIGSDDFWDPKINNYQTSTVSITPKLRGFAINNPDILSVSETLGLNVINVNNIDKLITKFNTLYKEDKE